MSIQDTKIWEGIEAALDFIFKASWKWPTSIRRVYVATWPIAIIVRFVIGSLLFLTMCVLYLTDSALMYFRSIWRGERPELNP